jgi:hypothetical protein
MIFVALIILFTAILLVYFVLPVILFFRVQSLQEELRRLTNQVNWLLSYTREKKIYIPERWEKAHDISTPKKVEEVVSELKVKKETKQELPKPAQPQKERFTFKNLKGHFEQKFVQSFPVWIGGVALALAGAFMVKYSIETGFLSPSVRIIIGGLFGIGLLLFGN